jgi:hypothetical protein
VQQQSLSPPMSSLAQKSARRGTARVSYREDSESPDANVKFVYKLVLTLYCASRRVRIRSRLKLLFLSSGNPENWLVIWTLQRAGEAVKKANVGCALTNNWIKCLGRSDREEETRQDDEEKNNIDAPYTTTKHLTFLRFQVK